MLQAIQKWVQWVVRIGVVQPFPTKTACSVPEQAVVGNSYLTRI